MQDVLIPETALPSDLVSLFAEVPWPSMLVTADGHVLALNMPMAELLGADAPAAIGQTLEMLMTPVECERVRTLSGAGAGTHTPARIQAQLIRPGLESLPVEIELAGVPDDAQGRLTLIVHPISLIHRRQQLILEFNRLGPAR